MATAVYPGSFDPVTKGHLDIIKRAAKINDHLIVAVLINSAKHPLFTVEERVAMLQECCKNIPNVTVESFDGLTVEFAKKRHASVMVRGLRAVTDFENEIQLAQTRAADHVDGDSGGLDGQASLQGSLTSDVLAQTSLNDAAHVNMIDLLGLDVCTVQSLLDDDGAQLSSGNVGQSATELADSGAACRCDNDLFHVNSLLNCVCVTFRKPFLSKRP